MRVTTTDIPGVVLIEPDVFRDPRGFFSRPTMRAATPTPVFQAPLFRTTIHSLCGARCADSIIKSRTPRGRL